MQNHQSNEKPNKWIYDFCRYSVAFVILFYGWAKLNGSQFTILDSELDKPLGEVSGFWLTWHYFGYSPFYGNLIALVQIAGGFLLLYRRTVLLGASMLFGIVGNIILIDIFYAIALDALVVALFLETALLVILGFHSRELVETFWTRQNSVFPVAKNNFPRLALKISAVAVIALLPPLFTYWVANYNNRVPTEIDGKWTVVSVSAPIAEENQPLTRIYFERNRARMAVFRFGDDKWKTHHFVTDPQTREINIWREWLLKGDRLFSGQYELAGGKLILKGELQPANQTVQIELQKR